jgi:hypothetical protein
LVDIESRCFKQDGTKVMSFKRTMLIPFRGHGVDDKIVAVEG